MENARRRKGMTIADLSYITNIPELTLEAYEKRILKMTEVHRIILSTILDRDMSYFDHYVLANAENISVISSLIEDYGMYKGAEWFKKATECDKQLLQSFMTASGMLWDFIMTDHNKLEKLPSDRQLKEILFDFSLKYLFQSHEAGSFIFSFRNNCFYITILDEDEVTDGIRTVLIRDVRGTSSLNCFTEFKDRFESEYRNRLLKNIRYITVDKTFNRMEYLLHTGSSYSKLDDFKYNRKCIRYYRSRKNAMDLPRIKPEDFFRCEKRNANCQLHKGSLPTKDEDCSPCLGRMKSWKAWEWIDSRIDDESFEKTRSFYRFKSEYPSLAEEFMEHFRLREEEADILFSCAWTYGSYDCADAISVESDTSLVNGNHRLIIAQRLNLKNIPYQYSSSEQKKDILVFEGTY